ncbi:MAG: endonuclease/exonuclease/phosphatase family protein [Bacteroidales bacterium]|nr:endonuclease/exonuclease/phosphatase family protein [Bacteroidales bacterium]MBR1794034.1 endonuclease/exonuclease/phosphatase family protein [Bacteroidales bacterium]
MAEVERKRPGWFSRLTFGTAALVIAGLLLLSYLSVFVNPAKAWFFTIFGLMFIPLVVLTTLFFIWALFRRSRMTGFLLLMLLPAIFLIGKYYQRKAPELTREPTLKVVSYNVGLFAHGDMGDKRLVLADSIAAYLRKTEADIICLQEFYLPNALNMDAWFRDHFPGYHADYYVLTGEKGHAGNVTLTRRPVLYKGKIDFEKSTNMALHTDVQLDSTVLRFYNCHFESYNISLSGLVRSLKKVDDEAVEDTGRKMRRSIVQRPRQVDAVMQDVDACPVRSVVLGDFNDNPLSYTLYRLSRGRSDAFVKAGKGFGATFRTLWPLLRIDYILYPRDLEAVRCEVPKVRYSDHYPVITTFYEKR